MPARWPTRSTWITLGLLACLSKPAVQAQTAPASWRETSTPAEQALDTAAFQGLDALFDAICVSAEVGSGKESEVIFKKALSLLGVKPEEAVFIDNQEKNLIVPVKMAFPVD